MAELRKWILLAVGVLGATFLISLSAGRCSPGKPPKAPPVKEGHVDQGRTEVPPPPPVPGGKTVTVYVPVPAVPLTPEQVAAEAKKLGMIFLTPEQAVEDGVKPGDLVEGEFHLFAKETFGPGPCGDFLTCFAWQGQDGSGIDLVGQWAPYQPSPVAQAKPPIVANEARWHFWAGPALLRTDEATDLGLAGGADYTGFRLWRLQTEFHMVGGYAEETGAQGLAALAIGF